MEEGQATRPQPSVDDDIEMDDHLLEQCRPVLALAKWHDLVKEDVQGHIDHPALSLKHFHPNTQEVSWDNSWNEPDTDNGADDEDWEDDAQEAARLGVSLRPSVLRKWLKSTNCAIE